MKMFSFAKALALGTLVCLTLPVACGDDDDSSPVNPGNNAGAGGDSGEAGSGNTGGSMLSVPGTSPTSKTITCGDDDMCKSTPTLLPTLFVDPCCASDMSCGVSTTFMALIGAQFAETCQAKNQPGDLDPACPDSDPKTAMIPGAPAPIPVPGFAGCCRADTGTCGVIVNKIDTMGFGTFASPNLGCVDPKPFTGKAGAACGGGGGGMGGAGGMSGTEGGAAGMGSTEGGAAGAAGAAGAGGAAGNPT
jgi:hypothetical protein